MDRRTTLAKIFGQQKSDVAASTQAATPTFASASGLTPYTGPFGFEQAAHLLRRTTFGATYQQVKDVANNGLDAAMTLLFEPKPMPEPPLNPDFVDDPCTPIGQSWVTAPYTPIVTGMRASREQSLRAWTLDQIRTEGLNIREKMVLFWHNHFPTSDIPDTRHVYQYASLLRQFALGNFREFTKAMTLDGAMLRYLNGSDNTANSPNENYARELLELFTIGKGPLAGPGDYTNYTEQDVVEMAKVLSGWRDVVVTTVPDPTCPVQQVQPQFIPNRHNTTTKQLSYRFNDVQIPNMGNQEYAHLIDIIFGKDEVARFICRKFYRWFVYYEITQQVEDEVIAPMAQILLDNDYEVQPALEALLRSEHFFDILNVGPMIKNPVDFVMGVVKTFAIDYATANLEQHYRTIWQMFRTTLAPMQMPYYDPPSVAGWKAYYQEPVYYRHWANSVTLPIRQTFTNRMLNQGYANTGFVAKIDVLAFASTLDNPADPNMLIDETVALLYPQPITPLQHDYLKGVLLPNQPDALWTTTYTNWLADPSNQSLTTTVTNKLKSLLSAMMLMPEFYLS